MIISHYGKQFFRVQFGDTIIACNPVGKDSKHKTTKFGADIALITLWHEDMNGVAQAKHGEKEPFVISGPGEYETQGVFVRGFGREVSYGKETYANTSYLISLEGMTLCFLGVMQNTELPDAMKEALDDVDVLFVPVGGKEALSPGDAWKLATKLEAKVVIPMDYEGEEGALKLFLKEAGAEKAEVQDKLTLKKKDIEAKQGEVMLVASTN